MKCPNCGNKMKQLLYSLYCPNGCDKTKKSVKAKLEFTTIIDSVSFFCAPDGSDMRIEKSSLNYIGFCRANIKDMYETVINANEYIAEYRFTGQSLLFRFAPRDCTKSSVPIISFIVNGNIFHNFHDQYCIDVINLFYQFLYSP